MTPFLDIERLAKSFGQVRVLHDLSLQLAEGEILALLGLSGSGKTTALRLLAGFETPDHGRIVVAGEDVTGQRPAQRGFGMVFQHYALFPHMTVEENIAFGLDAKGWDPARRQRRIATVLELVDMAGFGARRVSEISGGQQQRIALARALAPEPRILLLDEPLSNLDPSLRERTRHELRAAVREIGITTVLVTHEQEEAFHIGDRVAVLHAGRLQQLGTPQDLYRRPQRPFVATFVGRASTLQGTVTALTEPAVGGGGGSVEGRSAEDRSAEDRSVEVRLADGVTWQGSTADPLAVGEEVDLIVRPEALYLADDGDLRGEVVDGHFTGALTYCIVQVPNLGRLEVLVDAMPKTGDQVAVALRQPHLEPRIFRRSAG